MAKKTKKSTKRSSVDPAKFSLKELHAAFKKVDRDLKGLPPTGSLNRMKQDLKNAGAMLICDQGMLRNLTKA